MPDEVKIPKPKRFQLKTTKTLNIRPFVPGEDVSKVRGRAPKKGDFMVTDDNKPGLTWSIPAEEFKRYHEVK